jgi:hypothetical protein
MRCYGCECVCMRTSVCMCVRVYACVYVYVNVCGVVSFSRGAISVILSKHGWRHEQGLNGLKEANKEQEIKDV